MSFISLFSHRIAILVFVALTASVAAEEWNFQCRVERGTQCQASLVEPTLGGPSNKILGAERLKHIVLFKLETNKTLDEIPSNLFTELKEIAYVTINANVPKLSPDTFSGAENLEYLNLALNKFEALPSGVFLPLKRSLKHLKLPFNRISRVGRATFEHLSELAFLDLSYNQLTAVKEESFSALGKLKTLLLIGNHIETIEGGAFSMRTLKSVVLDGNHLKTVPASLFALPPNLEAVSLSDNLFENIDFQLPAKLNYLNVGHNPIRGRIELKRFQRYERLTVLLMANVSAEIVFPAGKKEALGVQRLNLSYDRLTNGESILQWLEAFPNLEYLNLEANDFTTLAGLKDIQRKFPRLNELHIGCNSFGCAWLQEQIKGLKFNFELFACGQPIAHRYQTKQVAAIDCV